jgi:glycosyltransferase involved in cell wall biosynthesis
MKGPLVSVLMPAFNAERNIGAAVLSVVNQTYRNWELVIIDDASTDATAREVLQFHDRRIRTLRQPVNRGLAAGLNRALAAVQGRFIARMDADDYMEPFRLAEQVRYIMLEGLAICGTGADKFGAESGRIINPKTGRDIIDSMLVTNPFVHPTIMIDRVRLGQPLAYNEAFSCEEDYELWSRIVTADNAGNLDRVTLHYRTSAGSNANRPQKKRLNRICLQQFAERFGIAAVAPVGDLSEFQMAGFVDAPGYTRMAAYAALAETTGRPKLGWLQQALLEQPSYQAFFAWLNEQRRFSAFRY